MRYPTVVIPVSYCSTDYLRLEATSISFVNFYDFGEMRLAAGDHNSISRLQWFNNCTVTMNKLLILSCGGRELSRKEDDLSAVVSLSWPTGPTATLNSPKWKVRCQLDEILLTLLREDYAMIQHIIHHNIGEESRHLDEWHVLENLPPLVLKRYKVSAKLQVFRLVHLLKYSYWHSLPL